MATFLYRLAQGSFRQRHWVLAAWLLLLVGFRVAATSLKTRSSDSFTIPGVQAPQANDLLTKRFPTLSADGAEGLIVFEAPNGATVTSRSSKAATEWSRNAMKKPHGVTTDTDPFQTDQIAPGRSLGRAYVKYEVQPSEITTSQQDVLKAAPAPARKEGPTAAVGGAAIATNGAFSSTELVGLF